MRDWLFAARETPDRVNNLLIYFTTKLLAFDFVYNYPNGAGNLEAIVARIEENRSGYLAIEGIWSSLQTAIVAYLNQNQISLEDNNSIDLFTRPLA